MSDFQKIITNSKGKEARTLDSENAANIIEHGDRRLGIERRQFEYSHYYPERRVVPERRMHPERRIDTKINS